MSRCAPASADAAGVSHGIGRIIFDLDQALRDAWAGLPLSRQQAIVRAVVDHLVVNPATQGRNRFDSGRLDLIWRL